MKLRALLITLAVGMTTSVSAFESAEDTTSLVGSYDKSTLTEISNELIKLASTEELAGEFDLASTHYARALKIREAIGLKSHKSYASILYLSSSAQFKAGYACEASHAAKEASSQFLKHGLTKFQEKAANDHIAYGKVCELVAMK